VRPDRYDRTENKNYRRRRDNGGLNAVRITIVLTVAIGLVVAALALTNGYEFDSGSDEARKSDPLNIRNLRSTSTGGTDGSSFNSSSTSAQSNDDGSSSNNSNSNDDSAASSGERSNTGNSNSDQLANVQSGSSTTAGETLLSGCTIHGRVTDDWGAAMIGVRVFATTSEGTMIESFTDNRGRYIIPGTTTDIVSVSIALAHQSGSGETFTVMNGDDVISLSLAFDPAESSCEVNFDSWNVQDEMIVSPIEPENWPDAASIYQYTRNAQALALNLGTDLGDSQPLQIQAWCDDPAFGCDAAEGGAYFIAENELEEGSPPIIAMLPGRSSDQSAGVPDNREYHEYGHYFLSLKTGDNFELPPGDTNHGGYYQNSSTRDSFVEGFAEFYSMMVSRHVDGDANAEIYTIGADYDLETDRQPWEAEGWWEEFSIAGLLLDLVDDDSDYAETASGLTGVNILEVTTDADASGTIISGNIVNTSPLVVRNADVTIRYLNDAGEVVGTQVTRVLPEVIAPTREGTFYAAPPTGLEVAQATATLGGIAKSDDDDLSIGLLRLMDMITSYERSDSDGARGVSSVAELHDMLTANESAANQNSAFLEISITDVDEIFVSHGFFADLDGDKKYNPEIDGAVGESSHPVAQFGSNSYAARVPRQDPDPYAGSFVKIDTGDSKVDAIIQISMPADGGSGSYAYVAPKDGSGQVELAVPPADQNAEVTIITAGKGYKPVVAFRVAADNFHEKVENGTISELQIAPVELEAGASLSSVQEKGTALQFSIMLGGIAVVMLVVASLIFIRRQTRKA
jgi:hypothetical protein